MSVVIGTNRITIDGFISEEPTYSHTSGTEKFFKFSFKSERYSGISDELNCIISERLIDDDINVYGYYIIDGSVRSRNISLNNGKTKCELYIFVDGIEKTEGITHTNDVIIESAFIVKQAEYRRTPLGRELVDFVVAVNRPNKKTDYIPCIAWGRNAKYIAKKDRTGLKVNLRGRFRQKD